MERLDRATILRALEAVAARLPSDTPHTLVIVGGAALVLLYNARETTKDVDAFLLTPATSENLRQAAREVAISLGLPEDWLNDGAKGYVHGLSLGELLLTSASLRAHALAPAQLLAMKLSAWRDDLDVEDARLLLSKLAGVDKDDAWRHIEPHLVPGRELKAHLAFEDLWEAMHGAA